MPRVNGLLVLGVCLESPVIPFVLDFTSDLPSQTLFGVEKLYLRNHMQDYSYMREWVAQRMLARFGLPHLRARMVNLYINEQKIGLYTAMEAVEQEYVFYRNFPQMDFDNFALYKVKGLSLQCGRYSQEQIELAQAHINDNSTPPYSFEDGNHREKIPVLEGFRGCHEYFHEDFFPTKDHDVILAYLRSGRDCGNMLVEEGLVDRDLGGKEWDPIMAKFINGNLAGNACDENCQNANLAADVDVDNFLKHFALLAVALIQDSVSRPMNMVGCLS